MAYSDLSFIEVQFRYQRYQKKAIRKKGEPGANFDGPRQMVG